MKRFKVIDPKGIAIEGKRHEKGATVPIADGPLLDAFLHFGQVKEATAEADAAAEAKAKAEAEAKARAEAEAKKKAEDEAKAKAEADKKAGK